ncbi:MAG: class I adenylate-forming enzyme family protein, partial [Alphaproteobacteria bacterium]|nr:class I adenylate-forming enzyme family protein [Alphaproteobacteria bacterium]
MLDVEINLATLIQDQAETNPNAIAVLDGARKISFGVFAKAINVLARALAAEGVGPSMKVGIDVAKPYDHWLAILAVMRLGAVSTTLPSRDGMERARQVDLDLILSTNPASDFKTAAKKFIYADNRWVEKARPEAENMRLPDAELAARSLGRIVFSSGTTGMPKGIFVPADRLAHTVNIYSKTASPVSRHYNGYGIESLQGHPLGSWSKGGAVVLNHDFRGRAEEFAHAVTAATYIMTSAATLGGILDAMPGVFPGRDDRVITVSAAALPVALRDEALARLCGRVEVSYSSMELGIMAEGDAALQDRHPGAVGFAADGVDLQIVDAQGRETPTGVEGAVRVRSRFMAPGYLNSPEATAQFFRDGWFCPGDRAFKEADGLIVILGRDSDVLNLSGAKFSASEIENEVSQAANVKDCCALTMPSTAGLEILVILVVLGDGGEEEAVKREAGERLSGIEIGNFDLIPVDEIPRNSRGKISRPQLVTWLQEKSRS